MERNETFELCPAQYDRARPRYPGWIKEIVSLHANIGPGGKLLEIGSGTGKATELFADSGASIECVDIGENLIGIARKKFAAFPNVKFIKAHFEDLPAEPASYDLIYSAAAFHWIRQPEGNLKVLELLKKEGRFAIIRHNHIGQECGFFLESQPIYESVGMVRDSRGLKPEEKSKHMDSAFFKVIYQESRPWEKSYTAGEYIDLIFTYSDHIAMREELKEGFKARMRELIDSRHGGTVVKKYMASVEIGERLQHA